MPSSEPRLQLGDGEPKVHARSSETEPQVVGPPVVGPPARLPPVTESTASGDFASVPNLTRPGSTPLGSPTHQQSTNHPDALPPLLSVGNLIFEAPAWLFSAALHIVAVILLGLFFIVPERSFELLLTSEDNEGFEEFGDSSFDLNLDQADEVSDESIEAEELDALEDPLITEAVEITLPVLNTEALTSVEPIQMALSGRSEGMQQRLLEAYGGTGATQHAVMQSLRWLARYQGSQGLWSMKGKYKNGVRSENHEAATGLALLAFQGAGFTPHSDPQDEFTKVTSRAWRTLLKRQSENGNFFHTGRHSGTLYTQAICTIALCELYGMTRDERYHEPAQRAIDYCVSIQAPAGGWRYDPGADSDLSVTGWFVMALQSARMSGLEVPSPVLSRIGGFLDSVSYEGQVFYGYHKRHAGATLSMTAEGLLCRQYLGWSRSDDRLQKGVAYLTRNLPNWESGDRDSYYWYYATQVCHHMEGKHWRKWNNTMKVLLPKHQVQAGPDRGSWDPQGDEMNSMGGRLFVTCLSTYMLEVYYRHLPLYQAGVLGNGP